MRMFDFPEKSLILCNYGYIFPATERTKNTK